MDYSLNLKATLDTSDVQGKLNQLNQQGATLGNPMPSSAAASAAPQQAQAKGIASLTQSMSRLEASITRLNRQLATGTMPSHRETQIRPSQSPPLAFSPAMGSRTGNAMRAKTLFNTFSADGQSMLGEFVGTQRKLWERLTNAQKAIFHNFKPYDLKTVQTMALSDPNGFIRQMELRQRQLQMISENASVMPVSQQKQLANGTWVNQASGRSFNLMKGTSTKGTDVRPFGGGYGAQQLAKLRQVQSLALYAQQQFPGSNLAQVQAGLPAWLRENNLMLDKQTRKIRKYDPEQYRQAKFLRYLAGSAGVNMLASSASGILNASGHEAAASAVAAGGKIIAGAGMGAAAGSIIPGVGTAGGALVGAATAGVSQAIDQLAETFKSLADTVQKLNQAASQANKTLNENVDKRKEVVWERSLDTKGLDSLEREKKTVDADLNKAEAAQAKYASRQLDYSSQMEELEAYGRLVDKNVTGIIERGRKSGKSDAEIMEDALAYSKSDEFESQWHLTQGKQREKFQSFILTGKSKDLQRELEAGVKADAEVARLQRRQASLSDQISSRKSTLDKIGQAEDEKTLAKLLAGTTQSEAQGRLDIATQDAVLRRQEYEDLAKKGDTSTKGIEAQSKAYDAWQKADAIQKRWENAVTSFGKYGRPLKLDAEATSREQAMAKLREYNQRGKDIQENLYGEEAKSRTLEQNQKLFEEAGVEQNAISKAMEALEKSMDAINAKRIEAMTLSLERTQRPRNDNTAVNDLARQGYMISRNSDQARLESYQRDMQDYVRRLVELQQESNQIAKDKEETARFE